MRWLEPLKVSGTSWLYFGRVLYHYILYVYVSLWLCTVELSCMLIHSITLANVKKDISAGVWSNTVLTTVMDHTVHSVREWCVWIHMHVSSHTQRIQYYFFYIHKHFHLHTTDTQTHINMLLHPRSANFFFLNPASRSEPKQIQSVGVFREVNLTFIESIWNKNSEIWAKPP